MSTVTLKMLSWLLQAALHIVVRSRQRDFIFYKLFTFSYYGADRNLQESEKNIKGPPKKPKIPFLCQSRLLNHSSAGPISEEKQREKERKREREWNP
jgi:hypothetical protein